MSEQEDRAIILAKAKYEDVYYCHENHWNRALVNLMVQEGLLAAQLLASNVWMVVITEDGEKELEALQNA